MYSKFVAVLKAKVTNLLTITLLVAGILFGNLLYSMPATADSLTAEAESYAKETETRSVPTQVKDAFEGAKNTFVEGTKNADKEVKNQDPNALSKQKMAADNSSKNKIDDYK